MQDFSIIFKTWLSSPRPMIKKKIIPYVAGVCVDGTFCMPSNIVWSATDAHVAQKGVPPTG